MKRTASGLWLLTEFLVWFVTLHFGFDLGRTESWGWLHDAIPAAMGLAMITGPSTIFLSDIRDLLRVIAHEQRMTRGPK